MACPAFGGTAGRSPALCTLRRLALPLLLCWAWPQAQAQDLQAAPVLAPGFAVVTGFSGAAPGVPSPPPGVNPADVLAIDPDGPVLRIVDTLNLGGPPRAQAVPAGKPLTVRAGEIGQVFAVALDDAVPPNIYAAATSAYGLPIVTPDADGDGLPERARKGTAGAAFMPGLFGPYTEAGPGTIWKISGANGQISLFANVTLDGRPNAGAALGGLAFDPASRQLFVADRDTGMIHAFALDGRETGRFDHGVQGLGSIGLPPIAFDPARRLDIASPAFDSTDPATWGLAPPARRVFGLAVHRGRLYYAVAAGARVFSVSLAPDGSFGADVRVEFAAPPSAAAGTEISKIIFDDAGHMLLAERAPPSGAYDFGALTAENAGRVLRLRAKPPGVRGPLFWEGVGEYAIGFLPDHRNGDGGIALGYGYDAAGFANPAACGGTLWTTGSQLRITDNPALGDRLAAGGPLPLDGLQGNAVSLVRPQNTPPFSSYFIDYDDTAEQAGTPGHMGDVATWRFCPPAFYPLVAELLLEESFCPAGFYFGRNRCLPAPCRPGEFYRAGRCERPECVPGRDPRDPACCPPGKKWNPKTRRCDDPRPRRPDLAIKKVTLRCGAFGPCVFQLIVSNVGSGAYNGPIAVGDQVSPGQVNSIAPPSADWQCAQYPNGIFACTNPNATLQPNQTLVFTVQVNIPQTLRGSWRNCGVVAGDKAKETNWSNNKSCVKRDGDKPDPKPDAKPNLTVAKTAPASCTRVSGNTYRCTFTVSVTNDGTADITGEVVVSDVTQTGRLVEAGGGNWSCQPASPLSVCRNSGGLRAGETQTFTATVEVEAGPEGRQVTNCIYPEEIVRRGSLPGLRRARLAASEVPRDLLLRLAEGPTPGTQPSGPGAGSGATPPPPPPPAPPRQGSCATVTIPPETSGTSCAPGTIEVRQPSGPPRCCTPESAAAGTCGPPPTIVDTCPVPNVRVGSLCCTPEQMRAGICVPPPTIVDTCFSPNVRVGNLCCTPTQIRNRTCGGPPPVVGCPAGQFRGDDGKCHDRRATPRCKRGTVWDGTKCTRPGSGTKPSCTGGLVWDGKRCIKPPSTGKPRCGAGTVWDGRRCVPPRTTKPSKPTLPGAKPPPFGTRPTQPGTRPGVAPDRTYKPPFQRGPGGPVTLPPQRGR